MSKGVGQLGLCPRHSLLPGSKGPNSFIEGGEVFWAKQGRPAFLPFDGAPASMLLPCKVMAKRAYYPQWGP